MSNSGGDSRTLTESAMPDGGWRRWTKSFAVSALLLLGVLTGFIAALDPYGSRMAAGEAPRPLMDINQRFMYPQLVRSGRFEAAILGTSTMRLLDPAVLSSGLGGPVVNLAMNAATPWEQVQIADLFTRLTKAPIAVIWGIDPTWCQPDADSPEKRLTPRPFPPWLYDDNPWNDWPELINLTTLEIATRLLAHQAGLMPARIRGDGYEVFTPPEAQYDLARARAHLFRAYGGVAPERNPLVPPVPIGDEERRSWRFPALAWLDAAMDRLSTVPFKAIVLPPAHLASLPQEGSAEWQRYQACKSALAELAARRGVVVVDYARASVITREDSNYWDPLHFRLPIAQRLAEDLLAVAAGRQPRPDGAAVVIRPDR